MKNSIIKKIFIIGFTIMIMATTTCSLSFAADSNCMYSNEHSSVSTSPLVNSEVVRISKDFLQKYYFAKDQYDTFDFSNFTNNKFFLKYINGKIEADNYESLAYDKDDKQAYKLTLDCCNIINNENYIMVKINAVISYIYKGADFKSGYGEENWLKLNITANGYDIIDWYTPYNEYDEDLRGILLDFPDNDFWSESSCELLIKQRIKNAKIKEYYDQLKNEHIITSQKPWNNNSKSNNAMNSFHSFNKSNISSWAVNNCSLTYPSSGNSNQVSNYYDFSTLPGNYDCTNFVSHALLAGGTPIYDTGYSGSGWFFSSISYRSYSWSSVSSLYSFLVNNSSYGPKATELSYTNIYAPDGYFPYTYGDLIQFHNGSEWIHSGVITSYLYLYGSSTTLEAGVTSRSSYNTYTLNKRQSEIYTGNSRRILRLDGYYA